MSLSRTHITLSQTHITRLLHLLVAVAAYGFLGYKLYMFDDWSLIADGFCSSGRLQIVCLAVAVALFPLNMFLEACKWRELMRGIEDISLREAQRQVYFGMVGAFLTPYRAGDFPTRASRLKDKSKWMIATVMGLVGSLIFTIIIVLAALPSAWAWFAGHKGGWLVILLLTVGKWVVLLLPFVARHLQRFSWKNEKARLLIDRLATMRFGEFTLIVLFTIFRYLCFSVQLWLVMYFVGVVIPIQDALLAIPLYYMLVTLTPNAPVIDPGIRGSWAMVVFAPYAIALPSATLAAIVVWGINTLLPTLVGTSLANSKNV